MKTKYLFPLCFIILHSAFCLPAFAQGSAFTYQGRLNLNGAPANGSYDLSFTVFPSGGVGSAVAGPLTNNATTVSNGLFTVTLDFGVGIFNGQNRWLEIAARTNGSGGFTPLSPRQWVTPAPYAIAAGSLLAPLTGSLLQGTYPGILTLSNGANSFSGNGAGLTGLNAANLAGTVLDARLSANVALRAGGNNFTSNQSLSGGNLSFGDATSSLQFPAVSGASAPMINLFAGGTANSNRMVLAHSPTYANWGLQYQDVNDQFNFLSGGSPVMTVALGSRNVGIGTLSPDRPLVVQANVSSELMSLRDDTGVNRWHLNLQSGGLNFAQSAVADGRLFLGTNGNIGIGTLAPSVTLDVAGAIRTRSGGIVFPDGSTQFRATDTAPLTTSGLPNGSTFTVTIGGTAATLSGQYRVTHGVNLGATPYANSIGTKIVAGGTIKVRRPRSSDLTWQGWPMAGTLRTLNMLLTVPGGSTVTWSNSVYPLAINLTQSDGTLYEELELSITGPLLNKVALNRVVSGAPPVSAPTGDLTGITLSLNASLIPNISFFSPFASTRYSLDSNTGLPTGVSYGPVVHIRGNPFSNQTLYSQFITNGGGAVTVTAGGGTLITPSETIYAEYNLRLADDGLPIEEFTLAMNLF